MASIKLEKLHKRYGKVHAVRGIDLEVADGEFVAFLGPSGCGKSSTMRCIAGLEEISSGRIFFNEQSVNRVRPRDRGVAMAFETYALYPTINVYENLAFPLRAAKWKQDDIYKRVHDIAKILEITDLLDRMPRSLSSGQQQRTGLARALVRSPEVFVLDEPISHLDTRQRGRMRAYLKRLHIDLNHTMVYVTHDQEEAMAMADRIAVMRDGIIDQVGTPDDIYHNPNNVFVAGFIGEPAMNFLVCFLRAEQDQYYLVATASTDLQIPLPTTFHRLANRGQIPDMVTLGIRPFYLSISVVRSETHNIPGKIFVVEPLGDSAVVSVEVANTRMQVVTEPDFTTKPKQSVWLSFDPDHILLFDKASGDLISDARNLL